jgi:hypothetical protein
MCLATLVFLFAAEGQSLAEENASNPLASVNNTDLRWKYTSTSGLYRHDLFVDGAYMLMPKLKLKYELHYNITDLTGTRQQDFEKIVIKPIYFPYQALLNESWGMKVAVGLDVIVEFGNQGKAIGVGADQLGPFAGLAFSNMETGLVLIPLVQHFTSINGPTDVNTTAARVIALQPFGDGYWAKADVIVPYDWENHKWPVTAEMQIGKNINSLVAIYVDGLVGLGGDRPFDAGVGFGLRFKY